MKRYICLALFLFPSLVKSVEFIDFGVRGGYRQDSLSWTALFDTDTILMKNQYDDLQSPEVQGFIKGVYKYLYVAGYADYGWIKSGKDKNITTLSSITGGGGSPGSVFPYNFKMSKVRGNLFDAEGYAGLTVPFWEEGKRYIFAAVFGGFSIHHQSIHNGHLHPKVGINTNLSGFAQALALSLSLDKMKRTWKGPLVGGSFEARPLDCFEFDLGYIYHFLQLWQKQPYAGDITLLNPGPIASHIFTGVVSSKFKKAHGYEIRGRTAYYIFPFWKVGLAGNYFHAVAPKKRKMHFVQVSHQILPAGGPDERTDLFFNGKAEWNMFDVLLETAFTF